MHFSDLANFEIFIFDGDGTLFDTNLWKFKNILEAVKSIGVDEEGAKTFAQRFIRESGIPRESKIYAEYGLEVGEKLLSTYNELNAKSLHEVQLVAGAKIFLQRLANERKKLILFSAGDAGEIKEILKHHELEGYFDNSLFGSEKVSRNIAVLVRNGKAVYFGDALKDYLTARELGYSFVYVDGYIADSMEFVDAQTVLWGRINSYLDIEGV